ncbi:glycosyltransferase family 4 protein [Cellulomonas marina]|uniref:Phosphatidylinositol alpha-mannosyltransferase n=1 Tax=Cellulomonas marina TaxID=988821 RepID=A0A1I1AU68_9CELL|nr:glycosyltransferase family 4 protein [Cellulomonas marina]GIG30253.1 GDP-mannose-dependent alpha-(1-2)-phosphatidylinositol mannosyltransferase [Cellulomonas marina]SFB41072.1 phosphatidylinositol alpha-mannosyltransferase [Cellulomonas marina]
MPPDDRTAAAAGTPRRLTVALVLDDGLDRPDGVQQYVLAVAAGLRGRGHDVHLVASTTERTDLPGLHVLGRHTGVSFNGNLLRTPLPAPATAVRRLLAEVPVDVLHVAMPYSPLLAGRVVARVPAHVGVVGTFLIATESPVVEAGARALAVVARPTLRRFDEVLALSTPAADLARRAFGLRTTVLGMPLDLAGLQAAGAGVGADAPGPGAPVPGAPGTSVGDEDDPDRPVRLVFLGRLVERKGARELVAALDHLARHRLTRRPWHLVLAGRGPLEAELRRALAAAGLADRVTLPGFVAEADKPALLAGADVVVLPSTGGESFGISVVEALACARGVVLAGDNPGYRATMEGLEDQLVEARDVRAFAAALARWVDDPPARRVAVAGQRAVARRHERDAVLDGVEAAYARALAARSAPRAPATPAARAARRR